MILPVDKLVLDTEWLRNIFSDKRTSEISIKNIKRYVFVLYFLSKVQPVKDEAIEIPFSQFSSEAKELEVPFVFNSHAVLNKVFIKRTQGTIYGLDDHKIVRPLYSTKEEVQYSGYNVYVDTDRLEPYTKHTLYKVNNKVYTDYKKALSENKCTKVDSVEYVYSGGIESALVDQSNFAPVISDKEIQLSHISHINMGLLTHCLNKANLPSAVRNTMKMLQTDTDSDGYIEFQYYQNQHGRNYIPGVSLQQMPKYYRNMLLSDYHDCDIKAGTFSILGNYALTFLKEDEIPFVTAMLIDPDTIRRDIKKELKKTDPGVTTDYVKTVLNSICYGAAMNEKLVITDMQRKKKKTVPAVTPGYTREYTPINFVSMPVVKGLATDIRLIVKESCKRMKKDGVLYNSQGLPMRLSRHINQGQKLSHIYQSLENDILKTIYHMPYKNTELNKIKGGIGLLLHDGIYIRKDIYNDIGAGFGLSSYIKAKTGYNILYK